MAAPALPRGRGGAAAPSERGGSYGQGQPVAHELGLRVPRGAGAEVFWFNKNCADHPLGSSDPFLTVSLLDHR